MEKFVLVLLKSKDSDHVVLVTKHRPDWQRGRLNLVGGHIEDTDATPRDAAEREVEEETGLTDISLHQMGVMTYQDGVIYCYRGFCDMDAPLKPRPEETEPVHWYNWYDAYRDNALMPNLRIIVPMMIADATDWVMDVTDFRDNFGKQTSAIRMIIPGDNYPF